VIGEAFGQHGAHHLLGRAVGDGDRAAVVLQIGAKAGGAEERADDGARDIGGRLGGGEEPLDLGIGQTGRIPVGYLATGGAAASASVVGSATGLWDSVRR
jgi:hypothetical protein